MGKKGGKGGRGGGARYSNKSQSTNAPKPKTHFTEEDMDDEIDAFNKQRDVIPLDVNDDTNSSDEDDTHPVFNLEGVDDTEEEDDDDDDEGEGEEDEEDYRGDKFAAKIIKQQKYLRRKGGGVEDDAHDDSDKEDEDKHLGTWVHRNPHGGDNADFDSQESDNDSAAEEEAEILRLQKEKAKLFTEEDFDLDDNDQIESTSDVEKNSKDMPKSGASKQQQDKGFEDSMDTTFEVKKDLNALSKEEQMAVVESYAPELVSLLSELRNAVDQLDNKVTPLIRVVKSRNDSSKEEIHYLETKQALLLAYCQAISFFLLLKAEGHSIRDHPVLARLVEIKNMLDKLKELDVKLPSELEDILNQDHGTESEAKPMEEAVTFISEPVRIDSMHSSVPIKTSETARPLEMTKVMKADILEKEAKNMKRKPQVSSQSMEMLKVREGLEKKLKQKGVFSSVASQLDRSRKSQHVNSQLETIYDFGDEVIDKDGSNANLSNGRASSMQLTELSKLVLKKLKNSKAVSGDDDLPQKDDFGERRRKHELRVLANAGVESNDDVKDEHKAHGGDGVESMNGAVEEEDESEDETYRQAKLQRYAKLSAKAELYSRTPMTQTAETEMIDGKRQINRQMQKNRGLTRNRKKQNPRTTYKRKHDKKVKAWKGAVRGVIKQDGSYGGETSGINPHISKSRRL